MLHEVELQTSILAFSEVNYSHFFDSKVGQEKLGGGFNFFNVHPHLGKIPMLTNIFQRGWNHQLEKAGRCFRMFWRCRMLSAAIFGSRYISIS